MSDRISKSTIKTLTGSEEVRRDVSSRFPNQISVSLAGPIGVGKTTLALVMGKLGYAVHHEEVMNNAFLADLWAEIEQKKADGDKDPYLKSAFPLQIALLRQRLAQIVSALKEGRTKVLFDRSIYEDCIFVLFFTKRGQMTQKECGLYLDLFWTIFELIPHPDLIIYCNANANQCWKRIQERDLEGETKAYDLNYIQDLCEAYEQFFVLFKGKITVLEVDMNVDHDVNGEVYEEKVTKICQEVNSTIERLMVKPYETLVF